MRHSLAELIPAGGRSTLPDGAASAGAATATIGSHPLALTLALACVPPPLPCRAAIAKDGPPALPHASLYEMFMDSVGKYPGNPCLGRREGAGYAWLTYCEAAEQAGALGSALVAVGLQPHGRVGVYGANSPEWMLAMQVGVRGGGGGGWGGGGGGCRRMRRTAGYEDACCALGGWTSWLDTDWPA